MTERAELKRLVRLVAIALLMVLTFWSALSSLVQKSPTFDEQGFIVRGLAYLRPTDEGGTDRIRVGHPPGLNAYNALLLAGDETVSLPVDDPSWQETSFHRPAELFLWEIGNDVGHIMFLARIQTVWLGLLLVALVGRWAAEMSSAELWRSRGFRRINTYNAAGLLAIAITAFDPNLLAHMRLATTDFGLTATAALAGYGVWRLAKRPSWATAALAGIGIGLMLNTKFTALLFLPFFGVVLLVALIGQWRTSSGDRGSRSLAFVVPIVVVLPLVVLLTLWAGTGFDISELPQSAPLFGGATLPLAGYLEQLLDIGGRLQVETPSFLRGQYSTTGWWCYFPVAFLLKTPLPTLLLLLGASICTGATLWIRQLQIEMSDMLDLSALLLPALGFFAIALTTEINLGYRHILPVLPFLFVFTGVSLGRVISAAFTRPDPQSMPLRSAAAWSIVGLTAVLAFVSLRIYPHYLAYFNVLAGGPDNGWRSLVDSNLDWGQDLQALKPWMVENGVERVWLSYFGEARPEYYDITYDGLDSFPPRLMNPEVRPFVPSDPAPGWYAISATNVQGVHFRDHDQFAYFRQMEPDEKFGHSIFLYNVEPRGEPVNLLLSGLQPDEIAPEDWVKLGSNDATLRWFDGQQVILIPNNGRPTWLAASNDAPLAPEWQDVLDQAQSVQTSESGYSLWKLSDQSPSAETTQFEFALAKGATGLLDSSQVTSDGRQIRVISEWQQLSEPVPVKIFIHVLDAQGNIVAQWDGLGAAWAGWRAGDTLRQLHLLELPIDVPDGRYRIVAGLYDPETGERWRLPSGEEFVELSSLEVPMRQAQEQIDE